MPLCFTAYSTHRGDALRAVWFKSGGYSQHDVRFGSLADICGAPTHVCFTPNSDHESRHAPMVMSALPPKADMCAALVDVC
jgi:hypothetical protein